MSWALTIISFANQSLIPWLLKKKVQQTQEFAKNVYVTHKSTLISDPSDIIQADARLKILIINKTVNRRKNIWRHQAIKWGPQSQHTRMCTFAQTFLYHSIFLPTKPHSDGICMFYFVSSHIPKCRWGLGQPKKEKILQTRSDAVFIRK